MFYLLPATQRIKAVALQLLLGDLLVRGVVNFLLEWLQDEASNINVLLA